MRNLKIAFLAMLIFCAQNFKSQNVLSPEKVFDLYFTSFINYDDNAVKELNSYTINFLGKNNTYTEKMEDLYQKKTEDLTRIFLSSLPVNVAAGCRTEARAYFSALMGNFRNAKYMIKSVKPISHPELKEQEITEITYNISFKVPSGNSEINIGDLKNIGEGEMRKYLIDATGRLKKADKTVSEEQTFNLYQVKYGSDTYYRNSGPQELYWEANGFYFRNIR